MEPTKLDLRDQFCRGCHLPHTLQLVDKKLLCEFCRRKAAEALKAITRPEPHLTRFRRWLARMIAPKKEVRLSNSSAGATATATEYGDSQIA